MIGKLICSGPTRKEALKRLSRALSEFQIDGVATTVGFHQALIEHPDFFEGELIHTGWLAEHPDLIKNHSNKLQDNPNDGRNLSAAQLLHSHFQKPSQSQ